MNTKLSDCTVAELLEFIDHRQKARTLKGIGELAEYLGCSYNTALRMKNSGRLDGCVRQIGRTITFDVSELNRIVNRKYSVR